MKTTMESSTPWVLEIAGLSEGAQAYLYGNDNELIWRRRLDYEAAERMRNARTQQLKDKIEAAIYAKQPALEGKNRCFWTSIVMRYFARHGIEAPDIETVRSVVKEFSGF